MTSDLRRGIEGIAFLVGFTACIPAANWLVSNVGTVCIPDGPCLVPVAPGLVAPSGVLVVGLALVLRDLVQRRLGRYWALAAIGVGAILSVIFAVVASSVVVLIIDSAVFLFLAFGSLEFLLPQIIGKTWMVLLSIPVMSWLRRRDERIGMPVCT